MDAHSSKGPQFVKYFPYILESLRALGGSARPSEVCEHVARIADVSPKVRAERNANGQAKYENQVAWARFYLAKAGLIDSSRHGVWILTDAGRDRNLNHQESIRIFQEVQGSFRANPRTSAPDTNEDAIAPEDDHGESSNYRAELLAVLQSLTPNGFERFSKRLLRESGFQDVTVTGGSGDGGIDGIGTLQVNALVSFRVLFQCKRYRGSVSSAQIRDFRGAMQGRADKGVVITTGSFTSDARKEAVRDGVPPIELIDGEKLVRMLEDLNLGLVPVQTFSVDVGFFKEYRV